MELFLDATWEDFVKEVEADKGIILFGASSCANVVLNGMKQKLNIKYIIDNDTAKHGTKLFEKYIISSAEKLKESTREDIILISSTWYSEIINQLSDLDFKGKVYSFLHLRNRVYDTEDWDFVCEKINLVKQICDDDKSKNILDRIVEKRKNGIKDYSDICEANQYFISDIMKPDDNEVFVDGGSFDGETVRQAIKFTQGKYKKIYAFEMDKENFKLIPHKDFDSRISFINMGLWNEAQMVSYFGNDRGSEIMDGGNQTAKCVALDDIVDDRVTFIKMDIEGAEQKALEGAQRIIKRDKPKLAICIYHKPEDLWEIPMYIKALVPEYKIYIRHHGNNNEETVVYGVIE